MKKFGILVLLLMTALLPSCNKEVVKTSALPQAVFKDLQGKVVKLSDYQGKPLLVNFWATWCGPCRIEIPMLNDLHRKYAASQLVILGVSTDVDGPQSIPPFLKEVPIVYPVVIAGDDAEEKFGGIWALPTTYFYSKDGKQIDKAIGLQSRDFFEERIHKIL